jgi:hypothetical protein
MEKEESGRREGGREELPGHAGSLNKHLSAVHLGLKPHACSQCDATFTTTSNLKSRVLAAVVVAR